MLEFPPSLPLYILHASERHMTLTPYLGIAVSRRASMQYLLGHLPQFLSVLMLWQIYWYSQKVVLYLRQYLSMKL